ncbi:MAG: hypothetical protein D6706_08850 [Chloroflexi bacterium]|nr:MAG: hypothetical protein D6706_08850 [Chloroflexota bacterium]
MLLLGLLIFAAGYIQLQTWFPADTFWQDFVMSGTLPIPEQYTGWDVLKYAVFFAAISASGIALSGFGGWLIATSVLMCADCGYKGRES